MSAPTAAPQRTGRRRVSRSTLLIVARPGRRGRGRRSCSAARRRPRRATLDPDNPDPDGAQALARVLDDQGVDVTVVRSADALDDADVDAGTTVVVTSTDLLGQSTIDRLARARRRTPAGASSSPAPAPPRRSASPTLPYARRARRRRRPADCADPTYAGLSLEVDLGARPTRSTAAASAAERRRPARRAAARAGAARRRRGAQQRPGAARRQRGRRAAAARPGATGWSGTSRRSTTSSATTASAWRPCCPTGCGPALWLVAIATIALLRVARPPARARWRPSRCRSSSRPSRPPAAGAGSTARPATGRTPPPCCAPPPGSAPPSGCASAPHPTRTTLVRDLARHTGRPVAEVDALLGPPRRAPATDHDLITLADQLAELDREVRRP